MASAGKNHGSKKNVQVRGPHSKTIPSKASKAQVEVNNFEKIDRWIEKRMGIFFALSLFLTVFFGAFLFEVKISTGGDDSHYIEMANDFMKGRAFPTWHGPLYSILLSLPMLIFGVNVFLLKIISFFFIVFHLVLFYLSFRKYVSPLILALILLIISVNSTILYFASQTYSEAMYMFLQALVVFVFIKIHERLDGDFMANIKEHILPFLVLGFTLFLTSLTRNIGIVALLALVIVLLLEKRFMPVLFLIVAYFVFWFPFRIYKSLVWGIASSNKGQLSEILMVNPYDRAQGSEDFTGMIVRVIDNSKLYLSKHFMIGLGLHDPGTASQNGFVTLLIIVLALISLFYAFKRSKVMLMVTLLTLGSMLATFLALQKSWDQMRMVVIYFPMLILLLSWGIQQLSTRKGYKFLALVLPLLLIFIFFKVLGQTSDKMKSNRKVLSKNLSGNMYYGFTPDWQNFLLMSKWVGENIPDSAVVASRKPSMSYIYSKGRDFYGMYRFPSEEPQKLVSNLRSRIGNMLVIPNAEFDKKLPPAVRMLLKRLAVAYVAEGNTIYGMYETREPMGTMLIKATQDYKLPAFTTDSLLTRVKVSPQNCFAVSPDTLVNGLKRNRVSYVIVASLRANPNMNTGNIINNIQRYLYFVEQKYPGILTIVHQVGTDAEEPAWLYRIDYNAYDL